MLVQFVEMSAFGRPVVGDKSDAQGAIFPLNQRPFDQRWVRAEQSLCLVHIRRLHLFSSAELLPSCPAPVDQLLGSNVAQPTGRLIWGGWLLFEVVKLKSFVLFVEPLERLFDGVAVGYAVNMNHGDILPVRAIHARRQ